MSGIPIPAVIPEGSKAFILCVPDDPFFYGVVMGALKVMTFRYYWEGSPEQIDAVTERFLTMYYDYQEQVGCMICDMVAECFETGNEALIEALANAIRNNPLLQEAIADALTQQGGGVPGKPISPGQAVGNLLPPNIRTDEGECLPDQLWGGMLYLVQTGNRVITDFFEIIEVATNTLESMEIVSKVIPAAGDYISSAAGFADQLAESLQEGYSGAYTEDYEQQLACAMFCMASETCHLSLDTIIEILNDRLTTPFDLADFGEIMAGVATGTWVGDEIADVMFLIFFSALKFGQQFGDQVGIRPLPVIMSLGADQLASGNWELLCECAEGPQLQVYNQAPNFGGTLRDTITFENGVPFVLEAINFDTVRNGIFIEAPDGNWTMAYTISPDPVIPTNPGEVTWVYVNTSGAAQAGVGPVPASDFPTPVDTMHVQDSVIYGCGWESFESFTLTITLTAI